MYEKSPLLLFSGILESSLFIAQAINKPKIAPVTLQMISLTSKKMSIGFRVNNKINCINSKLNAKAMDKNNLPINLELTRYCIPIPMGIVNAIFPMSCILLRLIKLILKLILLYIVNSGISAIKNGKKASSMALFI